MDSLLVIIRHGKADPTSPTGLDDHRPLLPKGHRQAAFLARVLPAVIRPPVTIISSPIVRARETAATIAAALRLPLHFDDRLSTGRSPRDAIDTIDDAFLQPAPHAPSTVVIVGHNPHFESLCRELLAEDATTWDSFSGELKTGAAVVCELATPCKRRAAKCVAHLRLRDEDATE